MARYGGMASFLDELPGSNGGVVRKVSLVFHDLSMAILVMPVLSAVRVATAATGVGAIVSPT